MSGAGQPEYNGEYEQDGEADGVPRFRMKGGGKWTMNRNDDVWYLCTEHSGSAYKPVRASDDDDDEEEGKGHIALKNILASPRLVRLYSTLKMSRSRMFAVP